MLCEKPIAMTADEAQGMVDVAHETGVPLMEAFMYRQHPSWVAVRELVASGRIGRLRAVDSWFSYYNDDPANIRNIGEFGGGALYDIGCYTINLSRMLFGGEPDEVLGRVVRDPALGVDILTSAILGFGDGTATFTVSTRVETDQRVHLYGDRGRISIDIPFNIPPDRPTRVRVVAGGEPPVAPGEEVLEFETARPVRRGGGCVRGGGARRAARCRCRPRTRWPTCGSSSACLPAVGDDAMTVVSGLRGPEHETKG